MAHYGDVIGKTEVVLSTVFGQIQILGAKFKHQL